MNEAQEIIIQKTAKRTAEQQDTTSFQQNVVSRQVRLVLWVTLVLIVAGLVSILQSHHVTNEIKKLEVHTESLGGATDEAKQAAIEARDSLNRAIRDLEESAEANENSPTSPAAIAEALRAVYRIEQHLCGGRCE